MKVPLRSGNACKRSLWALKFKHRFHAEEMAKWGLMPIYEYESLNPEEACPRCLKSFEVIQAVGDRPLSRCPECGHKVRRLISWCRTAIVEASEEHCRVETKIKEYESQGMWSHAAELADKHSEKAKDKDMRLRALDNYKKAGYDAASLEKHAKLDNE